MRFPRSLSSSNDAHKLSDTSLMKSFFDAVKSFAFKVTEDSAKGLVNSTKALNLPMSMEKDALGPLFSMSLLQVLEKLVETKCDTFDILPLIISKLLSFCKDSVPVKTSILQYPNSQSILAILLTFSRSILVQLDILMLLYKTHDKNKQYDLKRFYQYFSSSFLIDDHLLAISTSSFYKTCREFLLVFNLQYSSNITSIWATDFTKTSEKATSKDRFLVDLFSGSIFVHKMELSLTEHVCIPLLDVHASVDKQLFTLKFKDQVISFVVSSHDDYKRLSLFLNINGNLAAPVKKDSPVKSKTDKQPLNTSNTTDELDSQIAFVNGHYHNYETNSTQDTCTNAPYDTCHGHEAKDTEFKPLFSPEKLEQKHYPNSPVVLRGLEPILKPFTPPIRPEILTPPISAIGVRTKPLEKNRDLSAGVKLHPRKSIKKLFKNTKRKLAKIVTTQNIKFMKLLEDEQEVMLARVKAISDTMF